MNPPMDIKKLLSQETQPLATADYMRACALDALSRGLYVFPCKPRSKQPDGTLVPNGVINASNDEKIVSGWFTFNDNIGVATGKSGIAIVDEDHGIADLAAFEAWRTRNAIPETFTVRTGRRDGFRTQQYFLAVPEDASRLGLRKWSLDGASGEFRAGNGYGLYAGSIHPDTRASYYILKDLPFAMLPDCLRQSVC